MASMTEVKGNLASVAIDGKIYAIGGGDSGRQSAGVELLDPELNQWMTVKPMISARYTFFRGLLGCNVSPPVGFVTRA